MNRALLPIVFLVFALYAGSLSAATYHVSQRSPDASNAGPGDAERPWKTISKAAERMQPGDTVLIHGGIYREHVRPGRSGAASAPITYQAAPGEEVVLTGADRITGWTRVGGGIWKREGWLHRFPTHPDDAKHRLIGRCEQVILDGRLLKQVDRLEAMPPGSFLADTDTKVLYVHLPGDRDPNQAALEASVREVCFGSGWGGQPRDYITVRGIVVRHAANMAQRGALFASGAHWTIEDCIVESTNGSGVSFFGDHATLRRVRSRDNGQQGLGGSGRHFLLEEVVLERNNVKGYDKDWEAGAMKIVSARDGVVRRCRAVANNGVGLWFDIDVRNVVVEDCFCSENAGHGIFVEISGGFAIRNNLCVDNGTDDRWGEAGIALGESDHTTIENNTCALNPTGITLREIGPRKFNGVNGKEVSYTTHDTTIRHNVCALNRRYQIGLWWDNPFFGAHPTASVGLQGTPLDPAQARLRFDDNCYWMAGNQQLALWGCPWRPRFAAYDDLKAWQTAHGQDAHSLVADPLFVAPGKGDWRLRPESPARKIEAGRTASDPSLPGKRSEYRGYERRDLTVDGCPTILVAPRRPLAGTPWVWRAEFFDAFPQVDLALLEKGYHLVYINVGNTFGCPDALKHWDILYKELTEKHGFSRKPVLEGLSRGGLYCFNWAARNPEKVGGILADNAVLDFKSWPGGKGKGKGSPDDWKKLLHDYHFRSEAEALAYTKNPVDNLESLAKAKVPVFLLCGDADDVVPYDENGAIVHKRYEKLGGPVRLLVKHGMGHHPHGLEDPTPVVEFILRHGMAAEANSSAKHTFAIGESDFLLDGKPFVIRCGEIHGPRVPREYWRHRMKMARAMGLNTVCAYLFWNMHEPRPGEFCWSGQADAAEYCRTAQEEGLWVILRPGPYACAEWEMGGFPSWLLKHDDIRLRTRDPRYLDAAKRYLREVGRVLGPKQITRGGPILMVQVENEYGFFGKDSQYMGELRQALLDSGFETPLFACNPKEHLADGYRADLFPVVNFGSDPAGAFKALRAVLPTGPLMCGEFYPGWFDTWGSPHHRGDAGRYLADLEYMLRHRASFSIYMAHGGTTFGFGTGADRPFKPDTSSYDYDAPISEAGWTTEKFFKTRDLFARHLNPGEALPAPPTKNPVIGISPVKVKEFASLVDNLPTPRRDPSPRNFEAYDQDFGCILYRTKVPAGPAARMEAKAIHDIGQVFMNGERVGFTDRRERNFRVQLPARENEATLDILVEAMGRVNFGPEVHDRKGIHAPVTLDGQELANWEVFNLPLDATMLGTLKYSDKKPAGPGFYRAKVRVANPGDTFLDLRPWSKGLAWVNGHNLGRYWNIGPQQTMYVPGPWLKAGENEIVILDLFGPEQPVVAAIERPILDQLRPELDRLKQSRGRQLLEVVAERPSHRGAFAPGTALQEVAFAEPVAGRYFALESLSAHDGKPYAAIAEISLLGTEGRPLNAAGWTVASVSSEETEREDGSAGNAIDGQTTSFWHTQWGSASPGHPHFLVLDLGKRESIRGFRYTPRQGDAGVGGRIKDYQIFIGDRVRPRKP